MSESEIDAFSRFCCVVFPILLSFSSSSCFLCFSRILLLKTDIDPSCSFLFLVLCVGAVLPSQCANSERVAAEAKKCLGYGIDGFGHGMVKSKTGTLDSRCVNEE